jgi:thymidylate synthase
MSFDISEKFPALTTKKLAMGGVVGELLWIVEGSGDDNRLKELSPARKDGKTIWTDNANAPYWEAKAKFPGDLGRVYGVQWRHWKGYDVKSYEDFLLHPEDKSVTYFGAKVTVTEIDQLANIIHTLKTNPTDRRMVLSAFNVGELDQMALPPCHMFAQFYVRGGKYLDCQMYMRSADMFLGVPFNIASYSTLTYMLAQVVGLTPGHFKLVIGDAHIHNNTLIPCIFVQVKQLLDRDVWRIIDHFGKVIRATLPYFC